jgi:hypothetical protein
MFFGTIDDNVRRYLAGQAASFAGCDVVVGCSGNFTSEKVLCQAAQPSALHSNDVSLYSQLLADAMLGQRSDITLFDRAHDWLQPYLDAPDPWVRPAMFMFLLRLLRFEGQLSAYGRRMYAHYKAAFAEHVQLTAVHLASNAIRITSYFSGDVLAHYQRFSDREDVIFTGYFPFFKGDYEHQYKKAHALFRWQQPQYPLLDDGRKAALIRWLRQPGRRYMFLLNQRLPDAEPQMISHKRHNTWIYLYTNVHQTTGLFRRRYKDTGVRFPLARPSFSWSAETPVTVTRISAHDVQYYKQLFLARDIDFSPGEKAYAVWIGEVVLGFMEMKHLSGAMHVALGDRLYSGDQLWYLLSDFPVAPLPHARASKLIVMLSVCGEMRKMLDYERTMLTQGIFTTARTTKPVSMKYRGPMQLIMRNLAEGFLNYGALWNTRSFQEVYAQWWKQYGAKALTPSSKN